MGANKKILDKNITLDDYATFKKCRISDDAKRITFILAAGATYDVPMEHFLQWHKHPHYLFKDGRSVQWHKGREYEKHKEPVKFVKWRRVLLRSAVRVYLSDNTAYDVSWDTVLMACEKNYEWFGGLTDESQELTYTWHKRRKGSRRESNL